MVNRLFNNMNMKQRLPINRKHSELMHPHTFSLTSAKQLNCAKKQAIGPSSDNRHDVRLLKQVLSEVPKCPRAGQSLCDLIHSVSCESPTSMRHFHNEDGPGYLSVRKVRDVMPVNVMMNEVICKKTVKWWLRARPAVEISESRHVTHLRNTRIVQPSC